MLTRKPVAPVLVRFADLDRDDVHAVAKQAASATLGAALDGSTKLHILVNARLLERGDVVRTLVPIFPICGRAISSMHIREMFPRPSDRVVVLVNLFEALSAMPSLVDLAIQLNTVPDLAPNTVTAPVLFHLRRLELQCIFCGWLRLLAHSGTSLRDLILCNIRGAYRHNPDDGNLDVLQSVTHMRLDDMLDPTLVCASPNLYTLGLTTYDSKLDDTMPCLDVAPPTLRHLILGVQESMSGFEVWDVIDLFGSCHPAMARLRHLTLHPCLDWLQGISVDIDHEGQDARSLLQTLCRERRIALSLFQ